MYCRLESSLGSSGVGAVKPGVGAIHVGERIKEYSLLATIRGQHDANMRVPLAICGTI